MSAEPRPPSVSFAGCSTNLTRATWCSLAEADLRGESGIERRSGPLLDDLVTV